MSNVELIDRLCSVTSQLSDIVRKQALFIEEQLAVDDSVKKRFADEREAVCAELDLLELQMRPIHNTGCGKEGEGG